MSGSFLALAAAALVLPAAAAPWRRQRGRCDRPRARARVVPLDRVLAGSEREPGRAALVAELRPLARARPGDAQLGVVTLLQPAQDPGQDSLAIVRQL